MERVKLAPGAQALLLKGTRGKMEKGKPRGPYIRKTEEQLAAIRDKRAQRAELMKETYTSKQKGRPPSYLGKWHDDYVKDMRLVGVTKEQMCAGLNLTDGLFDQWCKDYPGFLGAWLWGGEAADALVTKRLFQRAIGYKQKSAKIFYDSRIGQVVEHEYIERFPPDMQAIQFWLTNRDRQRWKKMQTNELTGPDGEALQPPSVVINPVMPLPRDPEDG